MAELGVSRDKIAWIIVRARELEGKVQPFARDPSLAEEQGAGNLEYRRSDATRRELREFLSGMNSDELEKLVALMWIGRGTYSCGEWKRALTEARDQTVSSAADYLLATPALAEHLEAGLDELGISIAAEEQQLSH